MLPLLIIIDFKNGLLRSTNTLARTTFETLFTSSVSRTFFKFLFSLEIYSKFRSSDLYRSITCLNSSFSFFKLKWIEEQERNKTFDHLEIKEIDEAMQDRLHFKSSNISDFEKFQDIMEYKRASDIKIFSKLKSIIKPYQKLDFEKNRIFQFIATNQIGAIALPFHWSNYNSLKTVLDVNPKLDIVHTEGGIFFQIEMDQYAKGEATLKLSNDNIFKSYPVNQIQPTVFLSDMLPPKILENVKYVDVALTNEKLSRETRFNFMPGIAEPNTKTVIVSKDMNCSIQTLPNTVYLSLIHI